jgi:excisionase family DNA binding protein
MIMNAQVQQGLPNLPTAHEIALAKEGSRELSMVMSTPEETQEISVCMGHSEQKVHLPASAIQLLMDVLVNISQGNAVQIVPVLAELTTQQAADILLVSRPYLVKLLDEGKIEHRKVGSHRRIRYNDLLKFKTQEERARKSVLDELAAEAQAFDMGY